MISLEEQSTLLNDLNHKIIFLQSYTLTVIALIILFGLFLHKNNFIDQKAFTKNMIVSFSMIALHFFTLIFYFLILIYRSFIRTEGLRTLGLKQIIINFLSQEICNSYLLSFLLVSFISLYATQYLYTVIKRLKMCMKRKLKRKLKETTEIQEIILKHKYLNQRQKLALSSCFISIISCILLFTIYILPKSYEKSKIENFITSEQFIFIFSKLLFYFSSFLNFICYYAR